MHPLDILFPRSNKRFSSINTYLTEKEIDAQIPKLKPLTPKQRGSLEAIFIASKYSDELVADLMNRLKFQHETAITASLAELIYRKVWITCEYFIPDPDIIVPVPSDPRRHIQRGYSITHLIASSLSKTTSIPLQDLLHKPKTRPAQTTLDRKERLQNLNGAFTITKNPPSLSGSDILWLIDDICTTGTTLHQCAATLRAHYPFLKIYGIAVSGN